MSEKGVRILKTVAVDFIAAGLAIAGLFFDQGWAWNIWCFMTWLAICLTLAMLAVLDGEDGAKKLASMKSKFTQDVPAWWDKLTAIGTALIVASADHFFMAAVWLFGWILQHALYTKAEQLRSGATESASC